MTGAGYSVRPPHILGYWYKIFGDIGWKYKKILGLDLKIRLTVEERDIEDTKDIGVRSQYC